MLASFFPWPSCPIWVMSKAQIGNLLFFSKSDFCLRRRHYFIYQGCSCKYNSKKWPGKERWGPRILCMLRKTVESKQTVEECPPISLTWSSPYLLFSEIGFFQRYYRYSSLLYLVHCSNSFIFSRLSLSWAKEHSAENYFLNIN